MFVPLPTTLDFRRSASGFWSGTGFIAQGSIFLHRLFIFNSRLVCVCPACFHFPRQKCFWPTIKRGRCNSNTSKAMSKGAPKVSHIGADEVKGPNVGFSLEKNNESYFWYNVFFLRKNFYNRYVLPKKPFVLVAQKGNIISKPPFCTKNTSS